METTIVGVSLEIGWSGYLVFFLFCTFRCSIRLLSMAKPHELVPKREETIGAIGYIPKGTSQAKTAFHTLFFGKYSFNIRSSILLSEIPVSLICALCY